MLDLVDVGLAIFWLGLTMVFLTMARASQKVRNELSTIFANAKPALEFRGPDIYRLQPIFEHMISVDVSGFRISAAAAIVELALVLYHLFT